MPRRFESNGQHGIASLMKRVLHSISRLAEGQLRSYGITHAQWHPLFALSRASKPLGVAELTRELQMDSGAMTRLLDRIESKGLCRRSRGVTDRRIVVVELTAEGRELLDRVPAVLADVLDAHLSDFAPHERRDLVGYLKRMLRNGIARRASRRPVLRELTCFSSPEDYALFFANSSAMADTVAGNQS